MKRNCKNHTNLRFLPLLALALLLLPLSACGEKAADTAQQTQPAEALQLRCVKRTQEVKGALGTDLVCNIEEAHLPAWEEPVIQTTVSGTYQYDYNSNGSVKTSTFNEQGQETIRTYTYDEAGNLLTILCTGSDNSIQETSYTYDDQNRLLSKVTVLPDGLTGKYTCTSFDETGYPLTATEHLSDGTETQITYEQRDANGNVTRETGTITSPSGTVVEYKTLCTYDQKGNMLTKAYITTDGQRTDTLYGYDVNYKTEEAGHLIEKTETSAAGKLHYVYEYVKDAEENPTAYPETCTITLNGGPEEIIITWEYESIA